MRTFRLKLFTIHELSEPAKQKAIEWYKRKILDHDGDLLWPWVEWAKETIKETFFEEPEIFYSFSYSQGDGCSFKADIDTRLLIRDALPDVKQSIVEVLNMNCEASCTGNKGRYAFGSKGDVDFFLLRGGNYPNLEALIDKVREHLEVTYMSLCERMETQGYAELDACYEDENIIACLADYATEYEFMQDGRRFSPPYITSANTTKNPK